MANYELTEKVLNFTEFSLVEFLTDSCEDIEVARFITNAIFEKIEQQ